MRKIRLFKGEADEQKDLSALADRINKELAEVKKNHHPSLEVLSFQVTHVLHAFGEERRGNSREHIIVAVEYSTDP